MNVTASKIVLGLSLGGFAFGTWDHIFQSKASAARADKGKELTAGQVNRTVVLDLVRDPFNSVPLNSGSIAQNALPNESGKGLGELTLHGVMITFAERAAVINGKTLHEGETMQTPTGATIRAKKIGVGYCVIEGAGLVVMLRVDDPTAAVSKPADAAKADPRSDTNKDPSAKPEPRMPVNHHHEEASPKPAPRPAPKHR